MIKLFTDLLLLMGSGQLSNLEKSCSNNYQRFFVGKIVLLNSQKVVVVAY